MSRFRAFIKPRNDEGVLTDFIEVTEDVDFNATGTIKQQIDNDEFNVGQFKFSDFKLKLRNETGRYSDVDVIQSIFRFRRAGSIFKLTWDPANESAVCGIAVAGASSGATISEQVDIFIGVLNDESSKLDIDDQQITFTILSTDSIFEKVVSPFNLLSPGQLYSDALLAILDQADITEYLTVDAGNISLGLDQTFDVVTQYENQTVKEVLDDILLQANAVIFIKNETIFIKSRDGGATSQFTFTGQASNDAIEDIIKISEISSGLNRVFNYWTWDDTNLIAVDGDSVQDNQIRKKDFNVDAITTTPKRQAILNSQRDEFKDKKQRLKLTVAMKVNLLNLFLLDQVRIDYPTVIIPGESGGDLPIYGIAKYGEAVYGFAQASITIEKTTPYKIMGLDINTKKQELKFNVQEI